MSALNVGLRSPCRLFESDILEASNARESNLNISRARTGCGMMFIKVLNKLL